MPMRWTHSPARCCGRRESMIILSRHHGVACVV
jgi:hypothetical protein